MPTLGAILETITGLYIPPDGRVGFRAHELRAVLSRETLRERFRFRKVEQGVYVLVPEDPAQPSFELRSRRTHARAGAAA